VEQIERDMVRDFFMSAEEAKNYGLIDNVITSRGEIVDAQVIAAQATAGK
jgi:ATP-dependent protease ClpP protease subunit